MLAAIDPTLPVLIAAVASALVGLGVKVRRDRRNGEDGGPARSTDEMAAEAILKAWEKVIAATNQRADAEAAARQRCEEDRAALSKRVDELEATVRQWEKERAWEEARREWLDEQPRRRRRRDEPRDAGDTGT